jgi:3-oxoacyl-[acyl-carrier-protein] synthase II
VAVTGLGLVLPLGLSAADVWRRSAAGESGVGWLTRFDVGRRCPAAEVDEFDVVECLRVPKHAKFMSRSSRFAVRAAREAIAGSRVDLDRVDPGRIGLYTGSGETGLDSHEFLGALGAAWRDGGDRDFGALGGRPSKAIDPFFLLRTLSNGGLGLLAMELQARGPSHNFVQSEVASAQALAAACRDLEDGRCDVAVAGGHDALLNVSTFLAYDRAGLLAHRPPGEVGRVLDEAGDGLALGEGAAMLVLERPADAEARGAPILGRILGVGTATDAGDVAGSSLSPGVVGRAVAGALDSVTTPTFAVARGIGVRAADGVEGEAIRSVWPDGVPVTSFKRQTGYLGAATAAAEVGLALLALARRTIPPTAALGALDADLDVVRGAARPVDDTEPAALCLSGSWVGQAAAVLVGAGQWTAD